MASAIECSVTVNEKSDFEKLVKYFLTAKDECSVGEASYYLHKMLQNNPMHVQEVKPVVEGLVADQYDHARAVFHQMWIDAESETVENLVSGWKDLCSSSS